MSTVAISETLGSLGMEIGRELAFVHAWEFADREILAKAAEQFGEGVTDLRHVTEETPTLWERFRDTKRRYLAYVEAVILELAARDNVVLVGRGAAFALARVRHVLRVRISAPWRVRVERVARQRGLTEGAAALLVRQSDRELAARVKFLYDADWNDPLLYDVVLNTGRLSIEGGVRLLEQALDDKRLRPTPESRREITDFSIAARVKAALMAHPTTRLHHPLVTCEEGYVRLSGIRNQEIARRAVDEILQTIPGVSGVRDDGEQFFGPAVDPGQILEDQKQRVHRTFAL